MDAPRRRYIWVEDRRETRLPFSKFVMAATLTTVGLDPEMSYAVAEETEEQLMAGPSDSINVEDLMAIATTALRRQGDVELASRYREWVAARRLEKPILLLLGGVSGVGKSSVAAEVGARLRITTVVPTDAIREVMRHVVSDTLAPILHSSSFEAWKTLRAPVPEDHDPVIEGFRQQAEVVATGVRALVDRALREGNDLIVEGVHILPGLFDNDLAVWRQRAFVYQALLTVSDASTHRAHFLTRLERALHREPQRYLDHFDEIRRIERFVSMLAPSHSVPKIEVEQLDMAVQYVVSQVVDAVIKTP
ncbi:MAG TPA: ATP cone domain-containing protein [Acidimicrobiia bacterium]|nr:ATP cone domain-containing protein [Acidimicrobiia bacterium]